MPALLTKIFGRDLVSLLKKATCSIFRLTYDILVDHLMLNWLGIDDILALRRVGSDLFELYNALTKLISSA